MLIRIKNDNNIKQMTQSLLEKLKPEVVEALENNRNKYDFSITDLYTELDCKYLYMVKTNKKISAFLYSIS